MLKYLRIQNFAIIENVEIEFSQGLNILSGETGAGKSIIMDALNLILGGRASADTIRAGASAATVEALFEMEQTAELAEALENAGIELEGDDLIVRRIVQDSGKSRVFINDTMVNIATLNAITERLVDLCSQGDQRLLTKPEEQLLWLDRFADLERIRQALKEKFQAWKKRYLELQGLQASSEDRARRIDFLKFQIKELESANIQGPEEDEVLKNELTVLSNSETLFAFAKEAEAAINGSDNGERAMLDVLGSLVNRAEQLMKTDPNLAPAHELMSSLKLTLEEAGYFFRDYTQSIQVDEQRLEELNLRLSALAQLKRKYGPTLADVLSLQERSLQELTSLENHDESLQLAKASMQESRELYDLEAEQMSQQRGAAAKNFSQAIEQELADLNMERARFMVSLERVAEPTPYGLDSLNFLISANPGEPAQPIQRVASGGELSRIMLALHNVMSTKGGVRVYLFDEVDTGISGKTAAVVGSKLKKVATRSQVICITHLPQVASFADRHIRVEKQVLVQEGQERTICSVVALDDSERTQELARMLGGIGEAEAEAIANAEAMLAAARKAQSAKSFSVAQ